MRRSAIFATLALLFGLAYALITPPFEVPDEVGHYWRASSIAYGFVSCPRPVIPRGFRTIVYALWTPDRTQHLTSERLRLARGVMLEQEVSVPIRAYSFYSPAAYVPQIAAAFIARMTRLRPFYGFYVGRLATLIFSILVVTVAGEIAPALRDHVHAAALLPMSLFLFGSWSADAMTIAAAFLASSLIVAAFDRGVCFKSIIAASLWLALCKPSYALLSLLALCIPKRHSRDVVLLFVTLVGASFLSVWITMSAAVAAPRPDIPVDSHAQLQFIKEDPGRFARTLVHDVSANGYDYLRAMTGRFGMYDVSPPLIVPAFLLAILVAVGIMNGPSLPLRMRIAICAIVTTILISILAYLYITSSISGGSTIEGTQGRYILPVLPMLLCVLRISRLRCSVPYAAILAITGIANAVCVGVLVHRYW